MRNDFLTIPGTNYEINSQLICRNKKTGYVLKKHRDKNGSPYYSIRKVNQKIFCRSPKFFRRAAKAAADVHSTFVPIYSLDNKYEINRAGVVRNVATKLVLKTKANGKCVSIQLSAHKYISRAIADLLWEAHGKIIERRFRPCPCFAESNSGKKFFDNLTQCAHFLAPKVFLAVRTIKNYLCRRNIFIGEWKITYLTSAPPSPRLEVHELNREARRMKKLDEELGL